MSVSSSEAVAAAGASADDRMLDMNTNLMNDSGWMELIPKRETRADVFATATTGYRGQKVRIGVLDTGIDPATNRHMNDGVTPKLINVIDCTGSGDVDVSTTATLTLVATGTATAAADNVILAEGNGSTTTTTATMQSGNNNSDNTYWTVTGLTGRTLKLSTRWTIKPFPDVATATAAPAPAATTTVDDDDDARTMEVAAQSAA